MLILKINNKAFKEDYFLIRHIKSKHDEIHEKIRKRVIIVVIYHFIVKQQVIEPEMFENYSQDKTKITPNIQASLYKLVIKQH